MSNDLNVIKNGIKKLYLTHPDVHINVSITSPKVQLHNQPAKITDVYPSIFRVEENSGGVIKHHTIQYVDIITKNVEIMELNKLISEIKL